jgi:hypothetical protein
MTTACHLAHGLCKVKTRKAMVQNVPLLCATAAQGENLNKNHATFCPMEYPFNLK